MPSPRKAYHAKYYLDNKERINAHNREYYAEHREEKMAKDSARIAENPEQRRAYEKQYRDEHKEEAREYQREYGREQTRSNPSARIARNLRCRFRDALKGLSKSGKTLEILGCSLTELQNRLELLFKPGMTWENYGPVWHIDHVKACAKFDLIDSAQQRACFHYTNLQPLFAVENIKKGCR